MDALSWLDGLLLIPAVCGSMYHCLSSAAMLRFRRREERAAPPAASEWPAVTVLKPVRGLERELEANLRSVCRLDYPRYQVVLAVESRGDPALPLLERLRREYGSERVSVAVEGVCAGANGKINNLAGALRHARHGVIAISDSDVRLPPDCLQRMVAPLRNRETAFVCTLYRAAGARRWWEKIELLTLNADFVPSVVFAHETGASQFCLGASAAVRRADLEAVGGFEALAEFLVEDYEMGRRLSSGGGKGVLTLPVVETRVDLKGARHLWRRLVNWDQKTRAARPAAFFFTVAVRAVPFAALFAAARWWDAVGLAVLGAAVAVRMASAAVALRWGLEDREGLHALAWLPLRDCLGLVSWAAAQLTSKVTWRGVRFRLRKGGRLERVQ